MEGGGPAGVDVGEGVLGQVLGEDLAQARQVVLAGLLVQDGGEPAVVVQAEVTGLDGVAGHAELIRVLVHDADRHVADVDDALVTGEDALGRLGDDRRGVGVVEDPGLGRVLADVLDDVADGRDGAHAVGEAAGAAGLLADAAVLEGDVLVGGAHREAAGANLHEGEVDAGERGLGIGGVHDLALRVVLAHEDAAVLADLGVALILVVVQDDLGQREAVLLGDEHLEDAGGVTGTAADDGDDKLLFAHGLTSPCKFWPMPWGRGAMARAPVSRVRSDSNARPMITVGGSPGAGAEASVPGRRLGDRDYSSLIPRAAFTASVTSWTFRPITI